MKNIIVLSLLLISSLSHSSESDNIKYLNRIGYGPTSKSLSILNNTTPNKWLNDQIDNPNLFDDSEVVDKTSNLQITTKSPFRLFQEHDGYLLQNQTPFEGYPNGIWYENFKKKAIYDIYSENRLREMMVFFWFNHFNVNTRNNQASLALLNDYQEQIRRHAFGKFKDLVYITSHHPAMLRYLNNNENRSPTTVTSKEFNKLIRDDSDEELIESETFGYNENYAREFLELHTLGLKSGYTQKDIQELARVLTGFGMADFYTLNRYISLKELTTISIEDLRKKAPFNFNDSLYAFRSNEHDYGDKFFLNHKISGTGESELDQVIEIVSKNSFTAERVSKKLADYFLGESYDHKIVLKMKREYLSTDGDIAKVLKVLINSSDFNESVKKQDKFKDAYNYYLSMYKVSADGQNINDFGFIFKKLNELDFGVFNKITPEGYSLKGSDYISSQTILKGSNFSRVIIYHPNVSKVDFDFKFNFLSKLKSNIYDKESLYLYFNSSEWRRE